MDEAVKEPGPTLAEPSDEGLRLVGAAAAHGIVLRLVGGVGIWARCPSARRPPLARRYNDIDLVTHSGSTAAVTALFAGQGYEPNRMFGTPQPNIASPSCGTVMLYHTREVLRWPSRQLKPVSDCSR